MSKLGAGKLVGKNGYGRPIEATETQIAALNTLARGGAVDAATYWTLVRDGFARPSEPSGDVCGND